MFSTTVHASERTDVEAAVGDLRANCQRAGLSPALVDSLTNQFREVLAQVVESGQQLASIGSKMNVSRDVSGDGYSVKLVFGTGGQRSSFLGRIVDALRGR
jgi:hypothetical protein